MVIICLKKSATLGSVLKFSKSQILGQSVINAVSITCIELQQEAATKDDHLGTSQPTPAASNDGNDVCIPMGVGSI